MVVFASEEAHYSIQKMSSLLGIGEANVIDIKTNEFGSMIPEDLEKQIIDQKSKGHIPLAVIVTLGTTVRGAFDPVDIVAEICKRHQIWLHADGAWGGSLIFSKKNRYLIKGIEKTDSVTINPHKLLSVPQQCSLLLVKKGSIIQKCHSREATYLFQKDKFYDISYDCGDKYYQCARRCDVFKFWIMWKAKGSKGFEKHVDDVMEMSKYLLKKIEEREDFELVCQPMFVNVCFWYIPPCLKKYAGQNGEYSRRLHMVRKYYFYYPLISKSSSTQELSINFSCFIQKQPCGRSEEYAYILANSSALCIYSCMEVSVPSAQKQHWVPFIILRFPRFNRSMHTGKQELLGKGIKRPSFFPGVRLLLIFS